MSRKTFDIQDAQKMRDVIALVEASEYEAHALQMEYFLAPRKPGLKLFQTWETKGGWRVTIGYHDNEPIDVSVMIHVINGKKVAFYYGMSHIVDYRMIEEWREWLSEKLGRSLPHSNAMNFPPDGIR